MNKSAVRRVWRFQRGNQNPYIEDHTMSKKNKYKRRNNELQNIRIKLKIEKHEPHTLLVSIQRQIESSNSIKYSMSVNVQPLESMCSLYLERDLFHQIMDKSAVRRVWRFQRGNQNPYIEDHTMSKRTSTKGETTNYKTYT
jgi:hypothetical protein